MGRTSAASIGSTTRQERHEFLDVLRGAALLGIVLSNMISLSLYLYLSESEQASLVTASSDRVLDFLQLLFLESKFYTIFSVLFGIGFSILMTRTDARGIVFSRFFLRRAVFLFLIGLAHAVLFWHNDILESYAICGVLLLPFARAANRTILAAAAAAFLLPAAIAWWDLLPHGTFLGPRDFLFDEFAISSEARVAIWSGGTFAEILRLNASSVFGQVDYVITSGMIFKIYGGFLLGLYIGRNGIYTRLPQIRPLLKRVAIAGLAIGLPLNAVYAYTYDTDSALHVFANTVAILPLSAGYACLLAWLWTLRSGSALGQVFAPVGRMALTNYVGQSAISMLIFRGVGLGLGGSVGPTLYLPIGAAIYGVQLAASRAWLRHYSHGPLEWLWRRLTYGTS